MFRCLCGAGSFPRMLRGEYDLIITTNAEKVENCESRYIATQEVCLLVSKNHKFALRKKVKLEHHSFVDGVHIGKLADKLRCYLDSFGQRAV